MSRSLAVVEAPREFAVGSILYRAVDVISRIYEVEGGYGGRAEGDVDRRRIVDTCSGSTHLRGGDVQHCCAVDLRGMGPAVEARVLDVEDGATLGRCVHPRTYTVGWAQDEVDHIESFVECSSAHEYAVGQTVRLWRGSSGHLVGSSPTLIVALSSSLSLATGALAVFSGRKAVRAWPARRKGRSDVGTLNM